MREPEKQQRGKNAPRFDQGPSSAEGHESASLSKQTDNEHRLPRNGIFLLGAFTVEKRTERPTMQPSFSSLDDQTEWEDRRLELTHQLLVTWWT